MFRQLGYKIPLIYTYIVDELEQQFQIIDFPHPIDSSQDCIIVLPLPRQIHDWSENKSQTKSKLNQIFQHFPLLPHLHFFFEDVDYDYHQAISTTTYAIKTAWTTLLHKHHKEFPLPTTLNNHFTSKTIMDSPSQHMIRLEPPPIINTNDCKSQNFDFLEFYYEEEDLDSLEYQSDDSITYNLPITFTQQLYSYDTLFNLTFKAHLFNQYMTLYGSLTQRHIPPHVLQQINEFSTSYYFPELYQSIIEEELQLQQQEKQQQHFLQHKSITSQTHHALVSFSYTTPAEFKNLFNRLTPQIINQLLNQQND